MFELILGAVAVLAIGLASWQIRTSWGDELAVGVAVAGLALTVLVPFGSLGAIAASVFLYHRASTDQVRRLARRDDVEDLAELGTRSPESSPFLWGAIVAVAVGSIASTTLFGLPMDRLGDQAGLADVAGDETEHVVPDALTEDVDGPTDEAPGAEQKEGHPAAGEDGHLYIEGETGDIPVALEEHAYEPLLEALATDDQQAIYNLVQADDVTLIEGTPRIEVVETTGPASKIRLTEGTDEGTTGWVPFGWTHEEPRP